MASGVVSQAFAYLFPLATELYVKQRWLALRRLFLTGMQLTSIASLAVGALIFVYGQTILFVWMGNIWEYDHNLILVLASFAALMGTTIVPTLLLNGAGYAATDCRPHHVQHGGYPPRLVGVCPPHGAGGHGGGQADECFPRADSPRHHWPAHAQRPAHPDLHLAPAPLRWADWWCSGWRISGGNCPSIRPSYLGSPWAPSWVPLP
jgi:hypothetical protein